MRTGGLSRERLLRLHNIMTGYVERGEVPGIVTGVCRHGEIQVDAVGNKSLDGPDPVRRDTIFRIASMTKPIMAAATMILAEEGKLRLSDAVEKWYTGPHELHTEVSQDRVDYGYENILHSGLQSSARPGAVEGNQDHQPTRC